MCKNEESAGTGGSAPCGSYGNREPRRGARWFPEGLFAKAIYVVVNGGPDDIDGGVAAIDIAGHGLLVDGKKSTPFQDVSEAASYEEAAEQELLDISREYYRKGN